MEVNETKFAILTFTKLFPQANVVHLQMDNIATLSYISRMGQHPQQSFDRPTQRNLGLPSSEWDHDYCRVFTRNNQCGSRSSRSSNGFQQMETEPPYFQKDLQSLLDSRHQQTFLPQEDLVQACLTVCSCHVTYAFQSEFTLYSCLNVKELLARDRRKI